MAHDHAQDVVGTNNERALWWALGLTTTFLIAEVVAGVMTKSLALISDAAHMLTDTAALAIALFAIRIAKRPADKRRTFGYFRLEILAAAFNAVLLFLVAMYILYEAYQRLKSPPEIESLMMMGVATLGLGVNAISMLLLSRGKDSSLNMKGAYLEVWSDMLGSLGVIVGGLIIYWTRWMWLDSVIAVGVGLWVLPRTWVLLRETLNILLEGVPDGVVMDDIEKAVLGVPGVTSIHDLHVWAISSGKVSLTAHVVSSLPSGRQDELLGMIRDLLAEKYHISHTTLQIEVTPCGQEDAEHSFGNVIRLPMKAGAAEASKGGH